MKLEIYTELGWMPIDNRQKYYTEYNYDGTEVLAFDISPIDEIYAKIKNECIVRNDENIYIVKKINQRKTMATITCELHMDDWFTTCPYFDTALLDKFKTKNLSQILDAIKPTGWSIVNAGIRDIRRTPELKDVSNYDVLMACQSIFGIVYKFDTINKIVRAIDPDQQVDTGLYITPELNRSSFETIGDSENRASRISAYGKQNEDGSYINFASINGGKEYVEDTSYDGKVKWIIWRDERYTVPESLLADAKKKLETQAYPKLSYTVGVNDLAQYDERYAFLNFQLYYLAHTIINEYVSITQTIVKIKKYHDHPEDNELTLSTEAEKITSKVDKAISILGSDGEKITGSILQQAQEKAAALINAWAEKGFVYQTQNEIYILDKLPKESAKYCIRINLGGIAFSHSGWKGPYISAWTIDGKFNADFIAVGSLDAIKIKGCEITNGNNFYVDADGNMIAKKGTFTGALKGCEITSGNNFRVDVNGNMDAKSGTFTGKLKSCEITNGSNFDVDTNGNMTANNANITGNIKGGSITGKTTINVGTDLHVGRRIYFGELGHGATMHGEGGMELEFAWHSERNIGYFILNSGGSDSTDLKIIDGAISLSKGSGSTRIVSSGISSFDSVLVNGNLSVAGRKTRLVDTKHYGRVQMYAVESTNCLFQDYGKGILDENGICIIELNPVFLKTINEKCDYHLMLTKSGRGDIYYKEPTDNKNLITIEGTPGLSFSYIVTGKQRDYESCSLEPYDIYVADDFEIPNIEPLMEELKKEQKNIETECIDYYENYLIKMMEVDI